MTGKHEVIPAVLLRTDALLQANRVVGLHLLQQHVSEILHVLATVLSHRGKKSYDVPDLLGRLGGQHAVGHPLGHVVQISLWGTEAQPGERCHSNILGLFRF